LRTHTYALPAKRSVSNSIAVAGSFSTSGRWALGRPGLLLLLLPGWVLLLPGWLLLLPGRVLGPSP
jgi:hypothetical protein